MSTPVGSVSITSVWSPGYIFLSYCIATLGSMLSLELMKQRTAVSGRRNWLLLIGGSIALGDVGIWSMHFIGMMALELRREDGMMIPMGFSADLTVLSAILPPIIVGTGFLIAGNPSKPRLWRNLVAGTAGGIGVSIMHYIGMLSMVSDVSVSWDGGIIVASVLVGIFAATAAMLIFFRLGKLWANDLRLQLVTAMIMGVAVCGMHYTGMHSVTYTYRLDSDPVDLSNYASNKVLLIVILSLVGGTSAIMVLLRVHFRFLLAAELEKSRCLTIAAIVIKRVKKTTTTAAIKGANGNTSTATVTPATPTGTEGGDYVPMKLLTQGSSPRTLPASNSSKLLPTWSSHVTLPDDLPIYDSSEIQLLVGPTGAPPSAIIERQFLVGLGEGQKEFDQTHATFLRMFRTGLDWNSMEEYLAQLQEKLKQGDSTKIGVAADNPVPPATKDSIELATKSKSHKRTSTADGSGMASLKTKSNTATAAAPASSSTVTAQHVELYRKFVAAVKELVTSLHLPLDSFGKIHWSPKNKLVYIVFEPIDDSHLESVQREQAKSSAAAAASAAAEQEKAEILATANEHVQLLARNITAHTLATSHGPTLAHMSSMSGHGADIVGNGNGNGNGSASPLEQHNSQVSIRTNEETTVMKDEVSPSHPHPPLLQMYTSNENGSSLPTQPCSSSSTPIGTNQPSQIYLYPMDACAAATVVPHNYSSRALSATIASAVTSVESSPAMPNGRSIFALQPLASTQPPITLPASTTTATATTATATTATPTATSHPTQPASPSVIAPGSALTTPTNALLYQQQQLLEKHHPHLQHHHSHSQSQLAHTRHAAQSQSQSQSHPQHQTPNLARQLAQVSEASAFRFQKVSQFTSQLRQYLRLDENESPIDFINDLAEWYQRVSATILPFPKGELAPPPPPMMTFQLPTTQLEHGGSTMATPSRARTSRGLHANFLSFDFNATNTGAGGGGGGVMQPFFEPSSPVSRTGKTSTMQPWALPMPAFTPTNVAAPTESSVGQSLQQDTLQLGPAHRPASPAEHGLIRVARSNSTHRRDSSVSKDLVNPSAETLSSLPSSPIARSSSPPSNRTMEIREDIPGVPMNEIAQLATTTTTTTTTTTMTESTSHASAQATPILAASTSTNENIVLSSISSSFSHSHSGVTPSGPVPKTLLYAIQQSSLSLSPSSSHPLALASNNKSVPMSPTLPTIADEPSAPNSRVVSRVPTLTNGAAVGRNGSFLSTPKHAPLSVALYYSQASRGRSLQVAVPVDGPFGMVPNVPIFGEHDPNLVQLFLDTLLKSTAPPPGEMDDDHSVFGMVSSQQRTTTVAGGIMGGNRKMSIAMPSDTIADISKPGLNPKRSESPVATPHLGLGTISSGNGSLALGGGSTLAPAATGPVPGTARSRKAVHPALLRVSGGLVGGSFVTQISSNNNNNTNNNAKETTPNTGALTNSPKVGPNLALPSSPIQTPSMGPSSAGTTTSTSNESVAWTSGMLALRRAFTDAVERLGDKFGSHSSLTLRQLHPTVLLLAPNVRVICFVHCILSPVIPTELLTNNRFISLPVFELLHRAAIRKSSQIVSQLESRMLLSSGVGNTSARGVPHGHVAHGAHHQGREASQSSVSHTVVGGQPSESGSATWTRALLTKQLLVQ